MLVYFTLRKDLLYKQYTWVSHFLTH
jgi:hypothetical protein